VRFTPQEKEKEKCVAKDATGVSACYVWVLQHPPMSNRAEHHEFDTGAGVAGVTEFTRERCFFGRLGRHPASPRHVGRRYCIAEGSVPAQCLIAAYAMIGSVWDTEAESVETINKHSATF
jgi:hypothetical protein